MRECKSGKVVLRSHGKRCFLGCYSLHLTDFMDWEWFMRWKRWPDPENTLEMACLLAGYASNYYDFITVPPLSIGGSKAAEQLARNVSGVLEVPFVKCFEDRIEGRNFGRSRFSTLAQSVPVLATDKLTGVCLLVDDVITTGMTMSLCYELLVKAGVHVDGIVWTHTNKIPRR